MVVVPDATVVAKPLPSMVATDGSEEVQVTCVVILLVVPSEYVPEAVNCPAISAGTLEFAGVTDMDSRLAVGAPPSVPPVPPPHPAEMTKSTSRKPGNKSFTLIIHSPHFR